MDNKTILLHSCEGLVPPDKVKLPTGPDDFTGLFGVEIDGVKFNTTNSCLRKSTLSLWKTVAEMYAEYIKGCEGYHEPEPLSVIVSINMALQCTHSLSAEIAYESMRQLSRDEWEWYEDISDAFCEEGLHPSCTVWHDRIEGYWVRWATSSKA